VVQLCVLSGKRAGTSWVARRFPIRIGRASTSELKLEEDGIWDEHLLLELDRKGFCLKVQPNALARVNGQPTSETYLRNGDIIDLGVVSVRFWLSGVNQNRLHFREALSWAAIVLVVLGQIALLYWLLR